MKTKNTLLIIDMQNDFCHRDGALFVPGATADCANLAAMIEQQGDIFDQIILTQDSHQVFDIAHPCFWTDPEGNNPAPFTPVSSTDLAQGKWKPVREALWVEYYLEALEKQGEYPHTIWPEHCIWGSWGAAIENTVQQAVNQWARKGRYFNIVSKGLNPLTEHFGALRANIEIDNDPSTGINKALEEQLVSTDKIWIAGEAKSHCVANTIKQIIENNKISAQLIILDDCMSDVSGFENYAQPIFDQAMAKGAIVRSSRVSKL